MPRVAVVACFIVGLVLCGTAGAAQKAKPAPAKAKVPAPVSERLTCRTGPTDRQARLVVVVAKGLPTEFAYYSRLGTKVCSIYSKRGDAYTKWSDQGGKALVKLLTGNAELEYQPGHLKLTFAEVERMNYCEAYGELNGVIQVSKTRSERDVNGIFDANVPDEAPLVGAQMSQDRPVLTPNAKPAN